MYSCLEKEVGGGGRGRGKGGRGEESEAEATDSKISEEEEEVAASVVAEEGGSLDRSWEAWDEEVEEEYHPLQQNLCFEQKFRLRSTRTLLLT